MNDYIKSLENATQAIKQVQKELKNNDREIIYMAKADCALRLVNVISKDLRFLKRQEMRAIKKEQKKKDKNAQNIQNVLTKNLKAKTTLRIKDEHPTNR